MFDASAFCCRGQHQVCGYRPWVGFKGPIDHSMRAMWRDSNPRRSVCIALYSDYLNCYLDKIGANPENKRPGMKVWHERRLARVQQQKEEAERKRDAELRARIEQDARDAELRAREERENPEHGVWETGERSRAVPNPDSPVEDEADEPSRSRSRARSRSSSPSPERPRKGSRKGAGKGKATVEISSEEEDEPENEELAPQLEEAPVDPGTAGEPAGAPTLPALPEYDDWQRDGCEPPPPDQ